MLKAVTVMTNQSQKKKIRIFHTADIHIDAPFSRLDAQSAQIRRRELRGVFTSMMLYAKTNRADIVLIAGDLFDVEFAGEDTVSLIRREFEKMPECKFVISAGNHDPLSARSAYKLKKFPDNVYIFPSAELSCFSFDDLGVDVWGWSFVSSDLQKNPLRGHTAPQNGRIQLLCAHADITSSSSVYAPVSISDIEAFGAGYAALGHIHRHEGIKKFSYGGAYGYSGAPEGRSYDEPGEGGAYLADICIGEDAAYEVDVKYEKFSRRNYAKEQLDLTGVMTGEEAKSKIKDLIRERKLGEESSLRLTLSGMTGAECADLHDISAQQLGLFSLEIKDMTSPTFDCARFEQDMSVKGAFYRVLLPKLRSEDESEREQAAEALRIGFAALDGSDIGR